MSKLTIPKPIFDNNVADIRYKYNNACQENTFKMFFTTTAAFNTALPHLNAMCIKLEPSKTRDEIFGHDCSIMIECTINPMFNNFEVLRYFKGMVKNLNNAE